MAESDDAAGARNPHITESVTTLVDTNQVSKQTFAFDQYNNRSDVYEYDFGSGSAGSLVRHTHTDYLTGTSYTSAASGAYLPSLPTQVSVYDASSNEKARTAIEYDNYTGGSPNYAALVPRSDIFGLDSSFDAVRAGLGAHLRICHRRHECALAVGVLAIRLQHGSAGGC